MSTDTSRAPGAGDPSPSGSSRDAGTGSIASPIFLVGAERSGTTLLRLMLDHHPDVTWINEFAYAVDWVPANGWPEVDGYHRQLAQSRVFKDANLTIDPALGFVELVNDFLRQWQRRSGKPVVGAQVHSRFDVLLRIWPQARFIHLIRDPRDVARSRVQMGWAGNVWYATKPWIDAEALWASVRERVPEARRLDVFYEDLIRDPRTELARICRLMEVEYHDAMLQYSRDTTYTPIDGSLSEQWRKKLSAREIQLVEAKAAAMMEERGYALSGLPRIRTDGPVRVILAIHDKYGRMRFRVRRYGSLLWLSDVVSRRIGPKAWRRSVLEKLNAIDQAHIK